MTAVKAAVLQLNPHVRVIEIANLHLRRLCRWLGSSRANIDFNSLTRYILTESSRYCPQEDMGGYGAPGFDWQNPFTAYNCTWGFHSPTEFPTSEDACASGDGVEIVERSNSTTCPRQMLCVTRALALVLAPVCTLALACILDLMWTLALARHLALTATLPASGVTTTPCPTGASPSQSHGATSRGTSACAQQGSAETCTLHTHPTQCLTRPPMCRATRRRTRQTHLVIFPHPRYNGMRQEYLPVTRHMLSQMPDGRCPYPPGDRPGMLGFDSRGHYVGGHR